MKSFTEWNATEEMKNFFEKRTNMHVKFVQKHCQKIENYNGTRFKGLVEQAKNHDASKFEEPEYTPYLFITWSYKCKDSGEQFDVPKEAKEKMSIATEHHVKNNSHHAEFHSKADVDLINREDRDKPPSEMIDTTSMPDIDVAEMVADWMAMSEEKDTNPKDWADKNINVRWKFSKHQSDLIYELIDNLWSS